MTGRFLINDPTEKMGVGRASLIQSLNKMLKTNKKNQNNAAYNFMSLHHVVKLFIYLLVFFFSIRSEDIGCLSIRAVAASVFLLVKGL